MVKLCLIVVLTLQLGCSAHRGGVVAAQMDQLGAGSDDKIANLHRSARYPWRDDGRCAVRESSGDWATLVERCYHALDRSRVRFVDNEGVCPIAQAGAMSADEAARLVGICLLVQPEIAIGAVIVIGAVVVAAAIVAAIEAAERAKKPGCRCVCLKRGFAPDSRFLRVASLAVCAKLCVEADEGFTGWECK